MLKRVEVKEKAPLGGIHEMMWICAEAWKERVLTLDTVRSSECVKAQKVTKLEQQVKQLEGQLKELEKQLTTAHELLGKSVTYISKTTRARGNKKPRKANIKQVCSYVAGMSQNWDPESWDGNIWGDEEEDGGGWYDGGIRPDPPPPGPLYPSLEHLQIQPIMRRRQEQQVLPPVVGPLLDGQGQIRLGADGNPIQGPIPQPQPAPRMTNITEDYSQEEISHITGKLRQKSGEPVDAWLNRMAEEGGDVVTTDFGDYTRFSGLSLDSRVNTEFRAVGRAMGEADRLPLVDMYAIAAQGVFPSYHDWPEIKGQWVTLKDAVNRLTRLCTRESVSRNASVNIHDGEVPKVIRDAIIRDAPPHYRAAVLTILLGAAELTFTAIKTRLLELATLGDWGDVSHNREGAQPRKFKDDRPLRGRGQSGGGSRSDMWKALLRAGVPAEEIDGLPTPALAEKCKQKGLKINCMLGPRSEVAELALMLKEMIQVGGKGVKPSAPPIEEEEEEDSDDDLVHIATMRKTKKDRKKGKNKGRRSRSLDCYNED